MKKNNLGLLLGIGTAIFGGCSMQSNHYKDHRSHPIIVWPAGNGNVMIDAMDRDEIARLELYGADDGWMGTLSPGNGATYHTTMPLSDGNYKIRMQDKKGNITDKKFRKLGNDISPKDSMCM